MAKINTPRSDEFVEDWINEIIHAIRRNLFEMTDSKGRNRYGSGTLAASVLTGNKKPVKLGDRKVTIKLTMPGKGAKSGGYWDFINKGVKGAFKTPKFTANSPYSYKRKRPPMSALLPFVRSKKMVPRRSDGTRIKSRRSVRNYQTGIAYVIARSIYEKGIERVPFYDSVVNDERILQLEQTFVNLYEEDIADYLEVIIKD